MEDFKPKKDSTEENKEKSDSKKENKKLFGLSEDDLKELYSGKDNPWEK